MICIKNHLEQGGDVSNKLDDDEAGRFLKGKLGIVKVENKLLEFLSIVVVPATERFFVRDEFIVGKNDINYLGSNFERCFSNINIVEEPAEETKLRYNRLTKCSVDSPIIEELGGREKAELFLSQVFYLMKNVLRKDGTVYIFYVETAVFSKEEKYFSYENKKGKRVILCAVNVHWNDGWGILAFSVESPDGEKVGYRFFSRT